MWLVSWFPQGKKLKCHSHATLMNKLHDKELPKAKRKYLKCTRISQGKCSTKMNITYLTAFHPLFAK